MSYVNNFTLKNENYQPNCSVQEPRMGEFVCILRQKAVERYNDRIVTLMDWYRTTNLTNRAGFLIRCRDSFNFVVHICSQADISMISIFFLSLLINIPILILPSTPKKNTRHRRAFAAPPLASVKYGAIWDKRKKTVKDFRDYSLVLFPWRTSYRFLMDRSLRWCRKRIVWAAMRRVWRFLYRL